MRNNLADVAAQLESGLLALIQAATDGDLVRAVAESTHAPANALLAATFADKKAPSGDPWRPPAHDYGHPLLDATGELKSSGKVYVRLESSAVYGRGGGFEIIFSYSDEKAPWQNFGTKRGGRQHIPPRPLLPAEGAEGPWVEALESTMQTTIDQWLSAHVHV